MQFNRLGLKRSELNLHFTLPTGQTFRWNKTGEDEYTGLINQRVVRCCVVCAGARATELHVLHSRNGAVIGFRWTTLARQHVASWLHRVADALHIDFTVRS